MGVKAANLVPSLLEGPDGIRSQCASKGNQGVASISNDLASPSRLLHIKQPLQRSWVVCSVSVPDRGARGRRVDSLRLICASTGETDWNTMAVSSGINGARTTEGTMFSYYVGGESKKHRSVDCRTPRAGNFRMMMAKIAQTLYTGLTS